MPSISAYFICRRPSWRHEIFAVIANSRRSHNKIDVAAQQFAELIARDARAALDQVQRRSAGAGIRARDDSAGVEEHARQAAHSTAADSNEVNAFAAKAAGGTRLHSRFIQHRHHANSHHTPGGS
jgi:hypothetical protein